jgi:DNA polymerase III alpha subunit
MGNYTIYHLHSDQSNGTTNIDSVTKYGGYIKAAQKCGMSAMGFSEHGNIFEWEHKKEAIEAAGMKYIHAIEAYLTEDLVGEDGNPMADNYHCVLIAKNYDGVKELNLSSTGPYKQSQEGAYKEYLVDIETTLGSKIGGFIRCHFCGSQENPWEVYDMTVNFYRDDENKEQ